ncbi:MAG: hypothetical protein ACRD1Z_22040 [Vicinamibacteria bacterium]
MAWFIPVIAAIAGSFAAAGATRLFAGPSSTSQKAVEEQMRLQTQLEIQRMAEAQRLQREQTQQLASYAPLALGALALVMVLR